MIDPKNGRSLTKYSEKFGHQWNQDLEGRGYLKFLYPDINAFSTTTGSPLTRPVAFGHVTSYGRILPFIENPVFVESRQANYVSTDILARNEPMRLWTGSKARRIDVTFSYTLPHLAHFMPTSEFIKAVDGFGMAEQELDNVKANILATIRRDVTKGGETSLGVPQVNAIKDEVRGRGPNGDGPWGPFNGQSDDSVWNSYLAYAVQARGRYPEIMSIYQSALNHIRASVVGSTKNPKQGPPIVLLKWGTVYEQVPCIVRDYRLEIDDDAGYDTKTLLPQKITINLVLEEINQPHGSIPGAPVINNELPGHDSIINFRGLYDPNS